MGEPNLSFDIGLEECSDLGGFHLWHLLDLLFLTYPLRNVMFGVGACGQEPPSTIAMAPAATSATP